jgi:hypothetical protein
MGLFSRLKDLKGRHFGDPIDMINPSFFKDEIMGGKEAREATNAQIKSARDAADMYREFAGVLRADAEPLRGLRDTSLGGLLDVIRGGGDFGNSLEYRSVLNAANRSIPSNAPAGLVSYLRDRASNLASTQFSPYASRIATQAGVGAGGLNSTNALLQENANAQASILGNAGMQAGQNILAHQQRNAQTATGIGGMLAMMFSDERLKTNIRKVGIINNGIGVYEWEWKDKERFKDMPTRGFIAQDVQKFEPSAVFYDDNGIMHVDMFKASGVPMEALNG